MRITSGTLKNRKIKSREGKETRPTLERIKEAIFSIIGDKIMIERLLDNLLNNAMKFTKNEIKIKLYSEN